MIKDNLDNAHLYYNLSTRIKAGLEWLKQQDLLNIECGKYYINGDNLYANIQEYETKDNAKYEAHREYIDIQYMIKGIEKVGISDLNDCKSCIDYDKEKDIEFLNCNTTEESISLKEGTFLILYPHDAHKPSIDYMSKHFVKKVVVKVKINAI